MKSIREHLLSLISFLLLAAALAATIGGCAATPQRIAFNTVSVTHTTVDQAMIAWGDYVKAYAPPVDQEMQVESAYRKYQAAMTAVIDANKVWISLVSAGTTNAPDVRARIDQSTKAAATALAEVIEIIRTFTVKPAVNKP